MSSPAKGASILVLDTARLLDDSAVGKGAAEGLQARFDKADRSDEQAAEKLRLELERDRAALREKLLARARKALARIMAEREAQVVLPATAVIAWGQSVDVTAEVMKAVDEEGPL